MPEVFDALHHIEVLLDKGWLWSTSQTDVLLHPEDHALRIRYNRLAGTLSVSPELERRLDLIIPTPSSKSRIFRR